jgi:hypothetical protein
MKKRVKIILFIIAGLVVISGIIIPLLPFMWGWNPAYGTPSLEFPMGDQMNITKLAAYNTPDWGEPGKHHNGLDLEIIGPTILLSPCTGIIDGIWYNINPYSSGEVAMIHVSIRINYGWTVKLVLEPWANITEIRDQQLAAVVVKVGEKVQPGDLIGTLLYNYEYPHLHYMVMHNGKDVCPYTYSSPDAQTIYEEIAIRTNSTICHP